MAIATLPYPSMDFTPLDVLTADELDQLVANINAVNNGTVPSASIADSAITPAKINSTTFASDNDTTTAVAVGTSYTTLKTITIATAGLYTLWAKINRSSNSASGAIISMTIKKNSTTLLTTSAPTVANYAGNHETITEGQVSFQASVGDSITIQAVKDRNDFASNLGCTYSLTQVA